MIYENLGMGDLAVFHRPTQAGKIWILSIDDGPYNIEVVNYNQLRREQEKAPF